MASQTHKRYFPNVLQGSTLYYTVGANQINAYTTSSFVFRTGICAGPNENGIADLSFTTNGTLVAHCSIANNNPYVFYAFDPANPQLMSRYATSNALNLGPGNAIVAATFPVCLGCNPASKVSLSS